MPPVLTQVRCPKCGSPAQAQIEQLVDVSQEPAAKTRLLSGSLNLFRCRVCGYEGQLGTPLVYHDPSKELLLTYVPYELGLRQDDQERLLGQLINRAVSQLAAEQRKGYLLRPQAVLTLQGLIERVLEADGITKEVLDAQRSRIRLFEELLRTPPDGLAAFAQAHDAELDESFFQLATLTLTASKDARAAQAASEHLDRALALTSYGKELQAEEEEAKAAVESLRQLGERISAEQLLDVFVSAPNDVRVQALVELTRPALDYPWFQLLSERIEKAAGGEKARLEALRAEILERTQEIDRIQEARIQQAASLLKGLLEAPDLEKTLPSALPYVDELFLGLLHANLRAARERGDLAASSRLETIDQKIKELIRHSLPPGLRLAQELLETQDEASAEGLLEAAGEAVDSDLTNALMAAAQRLAQRNDKAGSERVRKLYRKALRLSMKAAMKGAG